MLIIRRLNCIDAESGIVTPSKWPTGAHVEREAALWYRSYHVSESSFPLNMCTGRPLTGSDDTRCCINTVQPPDDEHIMLETCRGL